MGVCIRECVYGNAFFTQNLDLEICPGTDSTNCVSVCKCVVVYECMECKEERRNQETYHIYTHTHTPKETFFIG